MYMRFRSYLPLIVCEGFGLHWYGGVHSGTLHWSPPFPSDICCSLPLRVGQLQVYLLTERTSWDFNIFCWLCPLRSKLTRSGGGIFIKVAQDNSCRTHKAADYWLKKGLNKLEFSFNKPTKSHEVEQIRPVTTYMARGKLKRWNMEIYTRIFNIGPFLWFGREDFCFWH